jgi:hypothetical protein
MAFKVTSARFDLKQDALKNEIENNYANLSILVNKYGARCKLAMEQPEVFREVAK